MRRGLVLLGIFILLIAPCISAVQPTISISPQEIYEANEIDMQVNVSNWDGDYEIKELHLNLNPLTPMQLVDYKGWTETTYDTIASWTSGSIATNVYLSIFELLASSPQVDENTSADTTLTLIDDEANEYNFTFPINIVDDNTPPELSDYIPIDGTQILEGITDQLTQLRAVDPETGVDSVTFDYVLCNYSGNITPEEHSVDLVSDNSSLFTETVDLSEYKDMDVICFNFSAINRGGEGSTYGGQLTVDGTAPQVFLVAPDDGDLVGSSQSFEFYADDNLAPMMTCELVIDDEVSLGNISAPDMDTVQIPSAKVEEGQHTWSINCLDYVGLQGSSETRTYTLDKTAPAINLIAPENGSIVADSVTLDFEVSDNYDLASVSYLHGSNTTELGDVGSFSVNIAEWPDGPNDITVTAIDHVGNTATKVYTVTIDRTAPVITLESPEENSTSDVHVNFTFTAQDNYDDSLDCIVSAGAGSEEVVAVSDVLASAEMLLPIGDYDWNVQCVDDAGNSAVTSDRSLTVIDLTGPEIAMNNPDIVYRGDNIEISFDVTDISGVDTVTAQMRDPDLIVQTISLEKTADTYTATVPTYLNSTLGTYTVEVNAVDTLNNSNSATDDIIVTYKYLINLTLDPTTASPSAGVLASGTVAKDDGSDVPESEAELMIPGQENATTITLTNGTFTHAFTAPGDDGTYDVTVSVLSAENSQTYTDTKTLTVQTPQNNNDNNVGGGGGGGSSSHHDTKEVLDNSGSCSTDWHCTAWSPCDGGKQKRTCVDLNHCSNEDSKRIETQSCTMPVQETTEDEDGSDTDGNSINKTRREVPQPEEYTFDALEEDPGDSAGIGKASGFLNLAPATLAKTLGVFLMMALLLGTLKKFSDGTFRRRRKKKAAPQDVLSGKDKLGLEDYLEKRKG